MKNKRGITLIALVITIIVLLVLAGVSLLLVLGDNGIINKAQNSKVETEVAEEKEILNFSVMQAKGEKFNENINADKLQESLNNNSKEGNKAVITEVDDESVIVRFEESKRYYEIDKYGNVNSINDFSNVKELKIECVNSNNEKLAEYTYKIFKNNYSIKLPIVEGYEAQDEILNGQILNNTTIKPLYYLLCNDDKTLVFTGIDNKGNIANSESEIVSYMIGDGSSTRGNGLKANAKQLSSVVRTPELYNGKPVTVLGHYAFLNETKIQKVFLSDNIEKVCEGSLDAINSLKEISFGKKSNNIENYAVWNLSNLKKVTFNSSNFSYDLIAFGACSKWDEIKLNNDNTGYRIIDKSLYLMNEPTLFLAPRGNIENFKIAEETTKLSSYSFAYTTIQEVVIPDSVITIENAAFNGSSLRKIVIGKNVKNIGNGNTVFWNSTNLKTVFIDSEFVAKNLINQTSQGALVYYADTIYIKSNITDIGNYIIDNYRLVESDKDGYMKYIKNV